MKGALVNRGRQGLDWVHPPVDPLPYRRNAQALTTSMASKGVLYAVQLKRSWPNAGSPSTAPWRAVKPPRERWTPAQATFAGALFLDALLDGRLAPHLLCQHLCHDVSVMVCHRRGDVLDVVFGDVPTLSAVDGARDAHTPTPARARITASEPCGDVGSVALFRERLLLHHRLLPAPA